VHFGEELAGQKLVFNPKKGQVASEMGAARG